MANKDIDNEPMLEETSDEVLLEETSGTEAMLEETSDSEVLLEEDSSESVLLEENTEILLEETTVQIDEEEKSKKKETQQDFTEIHERWDDKLPKEFIDKVLNNVSPYCSIEETEYKIFRFLDNWLNSDDDILDIDDFHNADDLRKFKKLKLEELSLARAERDSSQEARNKWKSILNDLHDIDTAIRHGANSIDDLKIALAIKHNVSLSQELDYFLVNKDKIESDVIERKIKNRLVFLLKRVLHLPISKESAAILDEMVNDMLQPLVKHFVKDKSGKKRKQQVIKTKADNNRKQQAITALKNTDTEAKTKRNVEAEARKAEAEAKKAEAAQKRKQIEAEEDAIEEIKGKRRKWGCISIIAIIFIYSLLPSSIKSCQKEDESEDYVEEVADVTYIIDEGGIENLDISSIEEMLEKKFDYVSQYDNYFEIRKKGKYGIADLKGNIRIRPQYDYISAPYVELGVVEVRKDRKYGMVSLKTFSEIIETKYDYISSVSEESKTFEVRANRKYGLFSSEDLSEIVAPTYDYIGSYHEDTGLFEVRKDSKYGLFSPKKRKEVVPCEYDYLTYDGGLYRVRKDWKNGYLNSDGSLVKPLQ